MKLAFWTSIPIRPTGLWFLKWNQFFAYLDVLKQLELTFTGHGVVPVHSFRPVVPWFALVAIDASCMVTTVKTMTSSLVIAMDVQRKPVDVELFFIDTFVRTTEAIAGWKETFSNLNRSLTFTGEVIVGGGWLPFLLFKSGTAGVAHVSASVVLTSEILVKRGCKSGYWNGSYSIYWVPQRKSI